VEAEEAVLRTN